MRGLKHHLSVHKLLSYKSHLLQMRGLKPKTVNVAMPRKVASFTDAWIETINYSSNLYDFIVASFTDAWIETR